MTIFTRKRKVLVLLALACVASGCITINLTTDEVAVAPRQPRASHASSWLVEDSEATYQTFRHKEDNIQVIISPTCTEDRNAVMSHQQRAHLLASAMDNGIILAEERFDQSGVQGWRLHAKGSFEDAPIEMTVQVMDNGECLYDLILISPHLSESIIAEFEGAVQPSEIEEVLLAH